MNLITKEMQDWKDYHKEKFATGGIFWNFFFTELDRKLKELPELPEGFAVENEYEIEEECSDCCGAEILSVLGREGTGWGICRTCQAPCDQEIPLKETVKKLKKKYQAPEFRIADIADRIEEGIEDPEELAEALRIINHKIHV